MKTRKDWNYQSFWNRQNFALTENRHITKDCIKCNNSLHNICLSKDAQEAKIWMHDKIQQMPNIS